MPMRHGKKGNHHPDPIDTYIDQHHRCLRRIAEQPRSLVRPTIDAFLTFRSDTINHRARLRKHHQQRQKSNNSRDDKGYNQQFKTKSCTKDPLQGDHFDFQLFNRERKSMIRKRKTKHPISEPNDHETAKQENNPNENIGQ